MEDLWQKTFAVPTFNETTIALFIIWSIMLFLMFWYANDAECGFKPVCLVVGMHLTPMYLVYLPLFIGLMNRVFTNGLVDQGSIPGRVIPKT